MTPIEKRYFEHLDAIGVTGRMAIAARLFEDVCAMIGHQIDRASPGLPERERKIRIAERLYMNEPETLRLLAMLRERHDGE